MPRATAPLLNSEVAQTVTTPGYLVEIGFTNPFRMCSRDTVTFRGSTFVNWGFELQGLSPSADRSAVNGNLTVYDPDRSLTVSLLSQGSEDRPVRVWAYYGDVPSLTAVDMWSPVELFNGMIGECIINPSTGRVSLGLFSSGSRVKFSPRLRITKANGFNWLPARGTVIDFNGERFKIEPE